MPRDNQGRMTLPNGTIVAAGEDIIPSQHNPAFLDVAQALTDSLSRDGRGGMRTNLNMGGHRVVNGGPAQDPTDYVTLAQVQAQTGMPVGTILEYAGEAAPVTFMHCDGRSLSTTTYAALFAVIGYRFGGSGPSFNIPDFRGRVAAGWDTVVGGNYAARLTSPDARQMGAAGGAESVTLAIGQMPKHDHDVTVTNSGGHAHRAKTGDGYQGRNNYLDEGGEGPGAWRDGFIEPNTGLHTHGVTEAEIGNNEAHPNVQPTLIVAKIIKVTI